METEDRGGRSAMRGLAVAAVALAGLAFCLTPVSERLDNALLDLWWNVLARVDARAAPDEIVIVGIDEASVRAIPEPPGMWHAPLGLALARVAAARPRAILFDVPLPERSFDGVKPGVDRALFEGMATAVEAGPFVAALNIDARTRSAREIHKPYLALLGESRLGLGLLARDADGKARRYSLLVPTDDGGFPTVVGRLCRALRVECAEGLIHFTLGKPYSYVPLKSLLEMRDETLARRLFRDRIVLVGDAHAFSGRVDAPVNLAAWEGPSRDTPAIVLQAQTLRTALAGAAPREVSRPFVLLLVSLAALLVLVRGWRMAGISALGLACLAAVGATAALRAGLYIPLGGVAVTLAAAVVLRAVLDRRPSGARA
jgi:CHASE2 domain-containing sensor protein